MKASSSHANSRLEELCLSKLADRRLILASNRGPVEYFLDEKGELRPRRGSGGVVTALEGISQYVRLNWIASAMREGDRKAVELAQGGSFSGPDNENLRLRFVVSPRSAYHKYYSVFSNPLLWFLQHYMWNLSRTPNIDRVIYDAWQEGYVPVNQAFAQAVIDEAAASELPPVVIINDYHLYLVSDYIKRQLPQLPIQHFIHIPWPAPRYWQVLPRFMHQAIIGSLCSADIVGLQTLGDVHSFLFCCQELLEGATADYGQSTVTIKDHVTRVKAYPVSVDVAGLRETTATTRFKEYEEKLRPLCGQQTIVRVDRAEPSKNIIRGFRAFDMLLERYPQFRGRLKFIAFLVPSRVHLKPYQRYNQDTFQLVEEINAKHGTADWKPIEVFFENNYIQALAGMCLYDVLLVNAVIDGMNLIAKEGPTVNQRDGVLVLSETVGAHEQLGEYALTVAPADLEGTVQSLYTALTMPAAEKKRRARALKNSIEKEDLGNWLYCLLDDASRLT